MKCERYFYDSGFWFRVNGYGLSVINRVKQPPPFSVRNGYKKELRFFSYGFQILTPSR